MHKVPVVLAYLACAGHGRRVQTSSGRLQSSPAQHSHRISQSDSAVTRGSARRPRRSRGQFSVEGKFDPLKAASVFILTFDLAAAFDCPTPLARSHLHNSSFDGQRRLGHRARVLSMSDEVTHDVTAGGITGDPAEEQLVKDILEHPIKVKHLGIIMDGNRRFARMTNLASDLGHRVGKQKLEKVLTWVLELNIPWCTVYALSTENLNRPKIELDILFKLYIEGFRDIAEDDRIHKREVRVQVIGRRELLPDDVIEAIENVENVTARYDKNVFTFCIAYGGREEILTAIKSIASEHAAGNLSLEEIDEKAVSERLYAADMPDPDLVIRTSGEERISNFLLWQMAYSELYFTDVFWPSFERHDLLKAVKTFQDRKRRFGK